MKTKNEIQKTVLESLAVFAFFTMISLTASAQDFRQSSNQNDTAKEIVLAFIDNSNDSDQTSIPAKERTDLNSEESLFKTESENTMDLEDWMTNDTHFKVEENPAKKKIIRTSTFVFEEMKDPELEFEDWMFNPKFWRVRK